MAAAAAAQQEAAARCDSQHLGCCRETSQLSWTAPLLAAVERRFRELEPVIRSAADSAALASLNCSPTAPLTIVLWLAAALKAVPETLPAARAALEEARAGRQPAMARQEVREPLQKDVLHSPLAQELPWRPCDIHCRQVSRCRIKRHGAAWLPRSANAGDALCCLHDELDQPPKLRRAQLYVHREPAGLLRIVWYAYEAHVGQFGSSKQSALRCMDTLVSSRFLRV